MLLYPPFIVSSLRLTSLLVHTVLILVNPTNQNAIGILVKEIAVRHNGVAEFLFSGLTRFLIIQLIS